MAKKNSKGGNPAKAKARRGKLARKGRGPKGGNVIGGDMPSVETVAGGTAEGASAPSAGSKEAAKADKVGPVQYVGQVRQEMRKVVWPGWPEVWKTTVLVMIMVIIMGAFFFVVDLAVTNILRPLLSLGGAN